METGSAICASCGATIEDSGKFCPACGAAAPAMGSSSTDDAEISALLATANLSRIRRRWEEAMEKCREALQRSPDSVSAHALLGDIYHNQNRNEEASLWYQMALDLNPDNTSVRTKLERSKTIVRGQQARQQASRTKLAPADSNPSKLDRFMKGEGFRTLINILTLVLGGLFLIVLIAFVISLFNDRQDGSATQNQHAPTIVPANRPANAPVAGRTTGTSSQVVAPRPATGTTLPPSNAANTPAIIGLTPPEVALLEKIRTEARVDIQIAMADPRSQSLTLVLHVPAFSGPVGKKNVLLQAKAAAQAACAEETQAKNVTVRVNAELTNEAGGTSRQIAFVGDISQQSAASYIDPDKATLEQLQGLFTSPVFWHPFLRNTSH